MIQLYPILRLRIKTLRILSELSSFLLSCIPLGKKFWWSGWSVIIWMSDSKYQLRRAF